MQLKMSVLLVSIVNVLLATNVLAANEKLTTMTSDQIRLSATDQDEIIAVTPYNMLAYEQKITTFYNNHPSPDLQKRIASAAEYFLEQPYFLEPIGEGATAKYSQEPLFRTDKFDCVSYVDTVLSLVKANNLQEFQTNLLRIRYANKPIDYVNRTDWFTDLEWIPNAEKLGWLKDVTNTIVDEQKQPIAKVAQTIIDKPNWYAVKPLKVMHLLEPRPTGKAASDLLKNLRSYGENYKAQASQLSYLPLNRLFINGKPNAFLFDQIPSGSVIAIVRPDWPIKDNLPGFPHGYGTNLNVSHLGIAIRTSQGLMFFNASSLHHKVMFEPLSDYLQNYLDSPTIKGIHLEQII